MRLGPEARCNVGAALLGERRGVVGAQRVRAAEGLGGLGVLALHPEHLGGAGGRQRLGLSSAVVGAIVSSRGWGYRKQPWLGLSSAVRRAGARIPRRLVKRRGRTFPRKKCAS